MNSPQIPETKKSKPKWRLDFLCLDEIYPRKIKVRLIPSGLITPERECAPAVALTQETPLTDCDCDC